MVFAHLQEDEWAVIIHCFHFQQEKGTTYILQIIQAPLVTNKLLAAEGKAKCSMYIHVRIILSTKSTLQRIIIFKPPLKIIACLQWNISQLQGYQSHNYSPHEELNFSRLIKASKNVAKYLVRESATQWPSFKFFTVQMKFNLIEKP